MKHSYFSLYSCSASCKVKIILRKSNVYYVHFELKSAVGFPNTFFNIKKGFYSENNLKLRFHFEIKLNYKYKNCNQKPE